MNERIKQLADQAGVSITAANENGVFTLLPDDVGKFAELLIRECAKWMSDGNIPDGFYESGRMLKHFGVSE